VIRGLVVAAIALGAGGVLIAFGCVLASILDNEGSDLFR